MSLSELIQKNNEGIIRQEEALADEGKRTTSKYSEANGQIYKYTVFPNSIYSIIQKLITIVQKEEYTLVSYIESFTSNHLFDAILPSRLIENSEIDELPNIIEKDSIKFRIKNALDKLDYSINFYDLGYHNILQPSINIRYNQFAYVKDFIDFVIEYRINNKLDVISVEEIHNLLDKFLEENQIEDLKNKKLVRKRIDFDNDDE